MARIAVMGAGAIGSLFGGYLSKQNEVILINRRKEHVDAIQKNGLVLVEPDSESKFRPEAVEEPSAVGPVDLIILSVKAGQTRKALTQALSMVGPDTFVLTVQNGYGNHLILEEKLDAPYIIVGTTSEAALYKEPGVVVHTGCGRTDLGVITGKAERISFVVEAFAQAGFETYSSENVMELIWRKLFVNVGINALTAVHKVQNGEIVSDEKLKLESTMLVNEAVAVAKACGYSFDIDEVLKHVFDVATKTAVNRSSMLSDMDNKKKTEIDVINGAVVKLGKEKGIETPHNAIITSVVRGLERAFTI